MNLLATRLEASAGDGDVARLRDFIVALTELAGTPFDDEAARLAATRPLLCDLVLRDDWLPPSLCQPDPQRDAVYLLHADPLGRFSVVSVVWRPGQSSPVHDHTVWGLIGLLRGEEETQRYRLDAARLAVPDGPATRLWPGDVDAVSPRIGDIHRVRNVLADGTSISIHVYGANIGAVQRWRYPAEGGRRQRFVSGYSNSGVPNLWPAPST
jgi:3-mercaptopropionate dioxygenase